MSIPKPFERDLYAGGQPTAEDLSGFAAQGVRTVISLRAPAETVDFDEAQEAQRLGLRYLQIPITGAADLDRSHVVQFGRALDTARAEGGVLIHCGSSNRVGAMIALDAALNRGQSLHAALARGRAAGLASLEPAVVQLARAELPA